MMVHASLGIYGDDVQNWTEVFGLIPDMLLHKGEPRTSRSGKPLSPRPLGVWSWSTQGRIQSDVVNVHLRHIVENAHLPRLDLGNMLSERKSWGRVFVFFDDIGDDIEPEVEPALLNAIRSSGLEFEIDRYHTFNSKDVQ